MPLQEMENKSSEVQIVEFHFKSFFRKFFFSPQQEMTKIEKKETKKKTR